MDVAEPPAGEGQPRDKPGKAKEARGFFEGATGGGPERVLVLTDAKTADISVPYFKQAARADRAAAPQVERGIREGPQSNKQHLVRLQLAGLAVATPAVTPKPTPDSITAVLDKYMQVGAASA